jgi:hypothetical protein
MTCLALATAAVASGQTAAQSPSGRVSFSVRFRQEVTPYPVMGMFVLPGEPIPLEVLPILSAATDPAL